MLYLFQIFSTSHLITYAKFYLSVYETIGCYHDSFGLAIPTLEGTDDILDGDYWTRTDPIFKCYKVAKKLGFKVFALQAGGRCESSSTAEKTFNKYGMSSNCDNDGKGGPNANQVYYIKGITLQLKQFTPCIYAKVLVQAHRKSNIALSFAVLSGLTKQIWLLCKIIYSVKEHF